MTIDDVNEVDDFELAFARLDWDLPSQREALQWHVAYCEAALAAVERHPANGGPGDEPTRSS